MSPRPAKQTDRNACEKPATPHSFGMCRNCCNVCARAGRPDIRSWPRRRKWVREHSTRKCAVCDSLTTLTYLGMDMAFYRTWGHGRSAGFGRMGLDRRGRAQAAPRVACLPQAHRAGAFRHGLQLLRSVMLGWACRAGQLGFDTTGVARPTRPTSRLASDSHMTLSTREGAGDAHRRSLYPCARR